MHALMHANARPAPLSGCHKPPYLAQIGGRMAEDGADMDALMRRMDALQTQIDAADGWELERQLERATEALRCPPGARRGAAGAVPPAPAARCWAARAGRGSSLCAGVLRRTAKRKLPRRIATAYRDCYAVLRWPETVWCCAACVRGD